MTSAELDRLDALAQEATPGPWDPWSLASWSEGDGDQAGMMRLDPFTTPENAAYIAALDPSTVRALVAVVLAAQAHLKAGRAYDRIETYRALRAALEALEALP